MTARVRMLLPFLLSVACSTGGAASSPLTTTAGQGGSSMPSAGVGVVASQAGTGGSPSMPGSATAGVGSAPLAGRSAAAGSGGVAAGAGAAGQSGASGNLAAGSGGASGAAGGGGAAGAPAACVDADRKPDAMTVDSAEQGMPPTGPFPVVIETDPTLKGFTVYRPKDLTQRPTFPVIVWENGGCELDGLLFVEFLRELSSYGIVTIVDGVPKGTGMAALAVDGKTLTQAMDWATQENDRPCSKYYRKLEPNNVAAMGQSCGGLHAYAVAKDPRVSTLVIWNSGLLNADQTILDSLHTPVAYFIGGMNDVSYPNADRDFKNITKQIPVFYGNLSVGHLATYSEDNGGEFGRVGAAWLRWQLLHDESAEGKGMFSGADCGLCKTDWVILKKNMD